MISTKLCHLVRLHGRLIPEKCKYVFRIIEEETNIHNKFQHGNVEQFQLMINTNELTDIIYAPDMNYMYPGGGDKAIADGAYLRINEYLDEYGLHYKNHIESTPMFKRDSRTDTGNIYGFSMIENVIQGAYTGMVIREDWLRDLGLDFPVTYDDWYNMLTRFKDEKGASAPMLLPENFFPDNFVLMSGYGVGYTVGRPFYQDNGTVKFGPVESGFEEYIRMMAKWYADGLIDKEFATRDGVSRNQLLYTKQAGTFHAGFWHLESDKRKSEDSDVFRLLAVANPVKNVGDKTHMRQFNHNVRGQWSCISAKTKYPIEAVRWLDNMYSETNTLLLNYGVEGEGFTWGPDGKPQYTDLIINNPDGLTPNVAQVQYMMQSGPMLREWWREFGGYTEDELACEAIWDTSSPDAMIPIHLITMTASESEEYVRIMNDINTFVLENCVKAVMGLQDINTDAFISQIMSMDIETAIKHQQAALDRYYARN